MRFIKTATVAIADLHLPGDFKARLQSDSAKRLAESLDHTPLLQRPGVTTGGVLLWGCDRVAAHKLRGEKHIKVDIWDGTAAEFSRAHIAENLFRRKERTELQAEWSKLVAAEILRDAGADEGTPLDTPVDELPVARPESRRPPHRPKTVKGAARDAAAKAIGSTPEAIRSAERRTKKKAEPTGPEQPPINMRGLQMANSPSSAVGMICQTLDGADRALRRVQSELTSLESALGTMGGRHLDKFDVGDIRQLVQEAARAVRHARPASACVYCKLLPSRMPTCAGCLGTGYLDEAQLANVPPELLAEGTDAVVYVGPNRTAKLTELG